MKETKNWKEKSVLFLSIFLPLLIYQLANYSASFIDTMMTGQYSTLDLAGVSVATSLWNPFFAFLTGIVSALVPIVGQYLGRGDRKGIREEFHQFIYLALGMALVLLALVWLLAIPALSHYFDLEGQVLQTAQAYLRYLSIGVLPLLLFSVCRSFFDALGLTRLSMYLMLLLVPFNSFFNYLLIYGKWGLPALGGAGAGLGTALSYWAVFLLILGVMRWHPSLSSYAILRRTGLDLPKLKEVLALGLPIGLQVFAEVAIFAVVGLYMAKFSAQVLAAHQAAMNFTTLLYAFPSSISSALPIVISYEIGSGRLADAKQYGRLGRWIALGFAGLTLSFLFFFRGQVAALYGSQEDFLVLTSGFLSFALLFQLADAFTAPIQGILRGYKDTRVPFVLGLVSYWSVTFPLAFLLEAVTDLGATSYWLGLIGGIFICGCLLHARLIWLLRKMER